MTPLTQTDLEDFAKLSIHAKLLDLAGVVRVSDSEARRTYGIKGGGDMAGIAFPYFDPETMSNGRRRIYVRTRRDHPELDDGKPRKKYVAPYGDRKRFYFPPTPELFADVTVPIVLVEAEKSSLAMTAWAARTGRAILPIAMGGCYGWIGKTGIKETPTGERVPEMGAIRDLGIARGGRRTYILLDANCASNPKVLAARSGSVRQFLKQGADVHTLDLPAGEAVNGPDDYIGVMGDDAMTQLFEGAAEGANILNDVQSFLRRFVILSSAQSATIALWAAHFPILLTDVKDHANIGMIQRGGSLRFALKTSEGLCISGHFFRQEFESDKTVETNVLGFIDNTHAPTAELLDDAEVRDGLAEHQGQILRG